jgi:hypothetical protein
MQAWSHELPLLCMQLFKMIFDQCSVLLLIGLPGSGRHSFCDASVYTVYWGFLDYFWNGCVLQKVREGKSVCLVDARLCVGSIFDKLLDQLLEVVCCDQIKVITFHNDPRACVQNQPAACDSIQTFSRLYKPQYYADWRPIVVPVYQYTNLE